MCLSGGGGTQALLWPLRMVGMDLGYELALGHLFHVALTGWWHPVQQIQPGGSRLRQRAGAHHPKPARPVHFRGSPRGARQPSTRTATS